DAPAQQRLAVLAKYRRRRQAPVRFLVLVKGGAQLLQGSQDLLRVALGFAGTLRVFRWTSGRAVGILAADGDKTGHQQGGWQVFHEGLLSHSVPRTTRGRTPSSGARDWEESYMSRGAVARHGRRGVRRMRPRRLGEDVARRRTGCSAFGLAARPLLSPGSRTARAAGLPGRPVRPYFLPARCTLNTSTTCRRSAGAYDESLSASDSAVSPRRVFRVASAPRASSVLTLSKSPRLAAYISGVYPRGSAALTSPPRLSTSAISGAPSPPALPG